MPCEETTTIEPLGPDAGRAFVVVSPAVAAVDPATASAATRMSCSRPERIPFSLAARRGRVLTGREADVVTVRIEDAEIAEAPRLERDVTLERPPGRDDSIPLGVEVLDLQHELDTLWHCTSRTVDGQPGGHRADLDGAASKRHVRLGPLPPVRDELEAENAHVEVHQPIQIRREELDPEFQLLRHRDGTVSPRSRSSADGSTLRVPAGGVNPGEGLREAANREVLEETGVVLDSELALLGTHEHLDGLGRPALTHFFRGDAPSGLPQAWEHVVVATERTQDSSSAVASIPRRDFGRCSQSSWTTESVRSASKRSRPRRP